MSSVKISELALITSLDANTSNSLFMGVDIPSGVTGKFTAKTLAQSLYSNDVLNVGTNPVVFPDVAAQFTGQGDAYLQVNLQNTNGDASGDYIVTADNGSDTTNFIDLGINGSTFSDSNYSSMKANDGYLVVQGNTGHPHGNLIIGTATSNTQIKFIVGGLTLDNVVGTVDSTGAHFPNVDTAISANLSTARTYTDTSNTFNNGISTTQNTRIDAAFTAANTTTTNAGAAFLRANAAFVTANAALANTTGTFGGDLTVSGNVIATGVQSTTGAISTGNLIVSGTANVSGTLNVVGAVSMNATLVLANSNFQATESAVTITASPTVATPSNDGYMIHISGKNGIPSRIVSDSYGTGAYSVYASRVARGNVAYPTAVQTGDIIGRFSGNGYGTTKFQQFGTSRIDFLATENYTDANTGSQIKFWNCPIGSNTLTNILTLNGDTAEFTGVVSPEKGFKLTPNTRPGITNTLNINFTTDSLYKVTIDNTATVNLSGYTAGKIVEVWMTNSSGSNRVVTHGCTALNSTTNATTFTLNATSSAYLKYFSIDGDNGNTFVSIVHA